MKPYFYTSVICLCLALIGCEKDNEVPILVEIPTSTSINTITANTATCITEIPNVVGMLPISARGVCWSKTQNPTIDGNHTTDGSGTGSFTSLLENLSKGTTYYVRAYTNRNNETSYGQQDSFTTLEGNVSITTSIVTNITATSALSGGNISVTGGIVILDRGICWSTNQQPSINDSHTSNGNGDGAFSSNIVQLSPSTMYYVRAYAKDNETTYYGDIKSFISLNGLPVVVTHSVTNIAATSAICNGEITDNGGFTVTERGFCWSTSPNPDLNDSNISCGSGNGTFSASIAGLTRGTIYYVRAYATNVQGIKYGVAKTFATLP